MNRKITSAMFFFALCLFMTAQGRAEMVVTLQEAVAQALNRSDSIIAGAKRLESASYQRREALGYLLPKVSLQERYMKTDTPAYVFSTKINQEAFTLTDLGGAPDSFNDPDSVDDFETTLEVEQVLFSRRAFLGAEMADRNEEAASLQFLREQHEAAFRVYEAYLMAVTAEAYLETAESAVKDAEEHLRLATLAVDAGTGLEADRLRAEAALGEVRRMDLKVRNDVELARRGLGLAMGVEEPVRPAPPTLERDKPDLARLEAAVLRRPDIMAMTEQVSNAKRNVGLMESEFLPDIGLFGALQANDPDAPFGTQGTSYRVGVGLKWNLFNGLSSSAKRSSALAEYEVASQMLEGMKKKGRFSVREAYLRAAEAESGLAISASALHASEESARLMRLRYENGLASMVSLLDTQAALNRTRSEVVKTEMEFFRSLGRAKHEAGLLFDELNPPSEGGPLKPENGRGL